PYFGEMVGRDAEGLDSDALDGAEVGDALGADGEPDGGALEGPPPYSEGEPSAGTGLTMKLVVIKAANQRTATAKVISGLRCVISTFRWLGTRPWAYEARSRWCPI